MKRIDGLYGTYDSFSWMVHRRASVHRVREKLPKNNMGSGVPGGVPLLLLCQDGSRRGAYRNNATKKISTICHKSCGFGGLYGRDQAAQQRPFVASPYARSSCVRPKAIPFPGNGSEWMGWS